MPALAALLIPLIPGLIQSILQIVDAIRSHADTPEAAKAQLDAISAQLDSVATAVAAVHV
jgi:hypothetical protein